MELKKSPKADLQNKKSLFTLIGLSLSLLLVILLFGWSKPEVVIEKMANDQAVVEMDMVEITREPEKPKEMPKPKMQAFADMINIVKNDVKVSGDANLFVEFDENVSIDIIDTGGKEEAAVAEDEIFMTSEDPPTFQGGDVNQFRGWVQPKLKYPAIASENGIQGRVTLSFVIERDGSLSNIKVLATPDKSLAEEAVRVVSSSPKWKPGKHRGMPVRVSCTLPVDFKIQN